MNKTILSGNLGFDAETRTIKEKDYIALTIAYQRGKDAPTTWYHAYYRKTPNNGTLLQYLKKGCKVLVEGILSASIYTSKVDNQQKVDLTIWANDLEILTFPKKEQEINDNDAEQVKAQEKALAEPTPKAPMNEDDLPF